MGTFADTLLLLRICEATAFVEKKNSKLRQRFDQKIFLAQQAIKAQTLCR